MELSELSPPEGARKRRKRLGRGESSGHGKTCCRGGKGQKGRKGVSIRAGFEGGQMPLYRRLPKFGFTSRKKVLGLNEHAVFNLDTLEAFANGTVVDAKLLLGEGKGPAASARVKILGTGTLSKKLTIRVHAVSAAARSRIEHLGGQIELVGVRAERVKGVKKAAKAELKQ